VQGDAGAQYWLGVAYYQGQGVPQDFERAAKWIREAAEQGYAQAQLDLGYLYHGGQGVPQDDVQATLWVRRAAEQGFPPAIRVLEELGEPVPSAGK
jgi:hypothetical protein